MGVMTFPGPEVTLLRHGETPWSRSGQHTGRTDVELTELGERQAKAAAALVGPEPFDLVLVSPRIRARRTAELAGLGDAVIDEDLAEWDYGELEGRTTAEIHRDLPGWSIWDGPWIGGENADQVSHRADRLLGKVRAQGPGARVGLVAHGHILRVVGVRWIDVDATNGRHLGLDTAAVCVLGWEHDEPVLHRWNLRPTL